MIGYGGGSFYKGISLLGGLGFEQLDIWVVDNIPKNDGVCRWANCRWEFSEYQGRVRITVDGQRRERLRRKLKRGQRGLLGVCCSGDRGEEPSRHLH